AAQVAWHQNNARCAYVCGTSALCSPQNSKIESLALPDVYGWGWVATAGRCDPCGAWGKLARHAYDLFTQYPECFFFGPVCTPHRCSPLRPRNRPCRGPAGAGFLAVGAVQLFRTG